jgi:hypothetical protein
MQRRVPIAQLTGLPRGCISYLPLNEGAGLGTDHSGNANASGPNGSLAYPTWSAGPFGSFLAFDGSGPQSLRIAFNRSVSVAAGMSCGLLVRDRNTYVKAPPVGWDDGNTGGYVSGLSSNGSVNLDRFTKDNAFNQTDTTVNVVSGDGNWYAWGCSANFSGGTYAVCRVVNGAFSSAYYTGKSPITPNPLIGYTLGVAPAGQAQWPWTGDIGGFWLSSVALTQAELQYWVQQLYANNSPGRARSYAFLRSVSSYGQTGSGGLAVGGSAPGALSVSSTASGGLALGGLSPLAWTISTAGSGGLAMDGSGAFGLAYSPDASGGLISGGVGTLDWTIPALGSGGVIANGASPGTFSATVTGSGGLTLGGDGAIEWTIPATGSGGLATDGQGTIGLEFDGAASGGLTAGGAGGLGWTFAEQGTGGLSAGGAWSGAFSASVTGSGGLTLGGPSTLGWTTSTTGSGGLATSGQGTVGLAFGVNASGGLTSGGAGALSCTIAVTPAGGLTNSGIGGLGWTIPLGASGGLGTGGSGAYALGFSASATGNLALGGAGSLGWAIPVTASGGLTVAGTGAFAAAFTMAASGSLIQGGAATGTFGYAATSSGGWSLAGSGPPALAFAYTAYGGLTVGASAPGLPTFGPAPSGGLALGGSFSQADSFSIAATGGLALEGVATASVFDGRPHYRIYSGDSTGGPVDYTTILATTLANTWTSPALSAGTSQRFAVRAFDPLTGLDDGNLDATVTVSLDETSNDVTSTPLGPMTLAASPGPGGSATASWSFLQPPGLRPPPAGFNVWLTAGSTVNYNAGPTASVPYVPGQTAYTATLSGLTGGATYSIGVRAWNATATEGNTLSARVVGVTTGPSAPDGATGSAL